MAAICSEVTRVARVADCLSAHSADASPLDNRLLAALPADVRAQLFPGLQPIWVANNKVLHEAGDRMRLVYFPTDAIISLSTMTDDGSTTEIAAIGNEGLIGLPAIMGDESSPLRATVIDQGSALCISRAHLMELFHRHLPLQQLLLRYAQAHLTQVTQLAVCNRRHSAEQQFCRWLLLRLDRCESRSLSATHEAIAGMLSVRRETISQIAGRLQKLDLIELSRGRLRIIDRQQIEALSCECYFVVRRETDRLLPPIASNRKWDAAGARSGNPRLSLS